eukprot:3716319-Pyramimonas_sp.AAC.1
MTSWRGTPARSMPARSASWHMCGAHEKPMGSMARQACARSDGGSPATPRASRCRRAIGGSRK